MMGKLIGGAAVSVLLAAIYIAGGLAVARYWGGYASAVTPATLAWFLLFLVMSMFIFGSLFIADRRGVQRPEGLAEHDDARSCCW